MIEEHTDMSACKGQYLAGVAHSFSVSSGVVSPAFTVLHAATAISPCTGGDIAAFAADAALVFAAVQYVFLQQFISLCF